jgi:hypothetical protein
LCSLYSATQQLSNLGLRLTAAGLRQISNSTTQQLNN